MGQRVPPAPPIRDYVVDELVEQFDRKGHYSYATARALQTAGSMRPLVPSTTFCAYCRRQHSTSPTITNCEGCGAPKMATGTGVLTFEGTLTDAEAENLKRHWERAFSGGTFWPMVPSNIVMRS